MNFFQKMSGLINDFFKNLSTGKRIAVVAVSFLVLTSLIALLTLIDKKTYVPLMTNLNPEDATHIMRILREKHIPFEVDKSGKNLSIPPEYQFDLRLELATMGVPQMSVIGYELFDKQSLGTTSFVQKMNQKRALEGELMRTINSIRGVKRSRVHLATPPKTVFLEEQRKTTASVVVELENGIHLSEKQIHGIGNLVAKAVEGLDPSDVMILNAEGKTLSKNINDPIALAANNQMESRERVEKDLSLRIETMLSHIVGNGKVAATVTADLDFSVVNETQTTFDSEASAIRSIEKRVDNMSGTRPTNAGAAGATSNGTTPQVAAGNEIKTETSKNNEVTNYEIPQTTRRINSSVGSIKKLSIAIVLDGKPIRVKEGEVMVTKKEPWSTEKIKEFEQIVASAVGLDRKRGDSLEIKNMDFVHEDFEEAERIITAQQNKVWMSNILMYTVFGLSIILFFFFLVRPFIRWLIENTTESVDSFLPQTVEELEKLQKNVGIPNVDEILPILPESLDPNKVEGEMIKEKVITLIDASPDKAALVLKHWLHKKEHEDLSKDKTA